MNKGQIKRIDEEILRLKGRGEEISSPQNYDKRFQIEIQIYIDGKIDSLKWVKENI